MSKRKSKEEALAFAEALVVARKKSGITLRNVETLFSIPASTMKEWENGRNIPDVDTRESILAGLSSRTEKEWIAILLEDYKRRKNKLTGSDVDMDDLDEALGIGIGASEVERESDCQRRTQ